MRPHRPRVAVVVLHHRSGDDTLACVEAVRRGTFLDLDLLVVDNDAPGPKHDALRAALDPVVEVVATGTNLGYAAGNNIGLRRALERGAEHVLLLNPDTTLEPDALERLVRTADELGDVAALGPRLLARGTSSDGTIASDGGAIDLGRAGATYHLGLGRTVRQRPASGPRDVDYVTGAALLLRADAVRDVGLLPEEYFLYFEETSYCLRLQRRGWRTSVDDRAAAVHLRRSTDGLPTSAYLYYMTRNRLLFAERELGIDPSLALADHTAAFLDPWRARVAERAPDRLVAFDALVARAINEGLAGRDGRVDLPDVLRPSEHRG